MLLHTLATSWDVLKLAVLTPTARLLNTTKRMVTVISRMLSMDSSHLTTLTQLFANFDCDINVKRMVDKSGYRRIGENGGQCNQYQRIP